VFASDFKNEEEKTGKTAKINNKVTSVRMRFRREGSLRWISHLDVQRTLEKALKRAKIPVSYSEGFHPRPRISIALPLPLGHASDCEWTEIVLFENMDPKDLIYSLQAQLPEGLTLIEAKLIPVETKPITSNLIKIRNRVNLNGIMPKEMDKLEKQLEDFLANGEIIITKKNQQRDIKPLIESMFFELSENTVCLILELLLHPTGGGVKPDEVVTSAFGVDVASKSDYRRLELFVKTGNHWQLP
jgi:radical SAM-linked protein